MEKKECVTEEERWDINIHEEDKESIPIKYFISVMSSFKDGCFFTKCSNIEYCKRRMKWMKEDGEIKSNVNNEEHHDSCVSVFPEELPICKSQRNYIMRLANQKKKCPSPFASASEIFSVLRVDE